MNPESSGSAGLAVLDLDVLRPRLKALEASLSSEERDRAERFLRPADADRYRLRRGGLRAVLGLHVGRSPDAIRYALGAQGKPSIEAAGGLRFNASSSGPLFAIALSTHLEVGVDIERLRPVEEWRGIAARLFPPGSLARIEAMPEEGRLPAFLRGWTAIEAAGKLAGTGLLDAEGGAGADPAAPSATGRPLGSGDSLPAIRAFAAGPSAVVALATRVPLVRVTVPALPEGFGPAVVPWVEVA